MYMPEEDIFSDHSSSRRRVPIFTNAFCLSERAGFSP
jgi:hypothetical protein